MNCSVNNKSIILPGCRKGCREKFEISLLWGKQNIFEIVYKNTFKRKIGKYYITNIQSFM